MSGQKHAFHRTLYFRVICGIVIGAAVGFLFPETGQALKPLGDAVIKLIKKMIAPIIFCTVVVGIAKMGHMRDVGRVGNACSIGRAQLAGNPDRCDSVTRRHIPRLRRRIGENPDARP